MRPRLLALLASLSLAACVTADEPTPAALQPELEHVVVRPPEPGLAPGTEDPQRACACADDGCVARWIDSNLGCGVCATFECGADVGALTRCLACEAVDE